MSDAPLGRLLREISSVNPRASAVVRDDFPVRDVQYDSRRAGPGSIFVCLRGLKRDGHDFATRAVQAGAGLVLGELPSVPGIDAYVQVDDSRRALALLSCALYNQPSRRLTLVGVTGTNGKTSVTWMCDSVFRHCGVSSAVLGTLGSGSPAAGGGPEAAGRPDAREVVPWLESGFTTPEAPEFQQELARWREAGVKAGACEVSSHALALRRIYGTRFACVAFTNLTPEHLDFHGDMDAYAAAKGLLFQREERGPDEPALPAVVNGEDPALPLVLRGSSDRVIRFGRGPQADLWPAEVQAHPGGLRLRIAYREEARLRAPQTERNGFETVEVVSPLVGSFQVENLLAAFGIAFALGLDPEEAAAGLGRLRGVPGRMERVQRGQPFPVLVDYAHTPDALARACESLRPFTPGRLLLVFGCGGDRDRSKRPLMGEAAARGADWCVLTDDNPRTEDPAAIRAQAREGLVRGGGSFLEEGDRERAIRLAVERARAGDTVLIAGKGHERFQIRGTVKVPFDDRVAAAKALEARP